MQDAVAQQRALNLYSPFLWDVIEEFTESLFKYNFKQQQKPNIEAQIGGNQFINRAYVNFPMAIFHGNQYSQNCTL